MGRLSTRLGVPVAGEVWAGDDGAVLTGGLVVATDPMVEGVHFLRTLTTLADAGWKAVARNVSDVAAMGAVPWRCVVSVVGASEVELAEVYDGLLSAADRWSCPVVGGDLASGPSLVITVTMLGRLPAGKFPLLRSGARPGDGIYLTAPVGWGAAGLRHLRQNAAAASPAAAWYARPRPSVEAALAARVAGATAAIDISDGLAADLGHLATASGVGFRLDNVPIAAGAAIDEALYGGDDYHLAFACCDTGGGASPIPGLRLGVCTDDRRERTYLGHALASAGGWEHPL